MKRLLGAVVVAAVLLTTAGAARAQTALTNAQAQKITFGSRYADETLGVYRSWTATSLFQAMSKIATGSMPAGVDLIIQTALAVEIARITAAAGTITAGGTAASTYEFKVDGANGNITTEGSLAFYNNDMAGASVGGFTAAGAITGVSLDRSSAGALPVGSGGVATSVTVGNNDAVTAVDIGFGGGTPSMTTNKGELNVDLAGTFDTTLGVTGLATLSGGATINNATITDDQVTHTITTGGGGRFTATISPLDLTANRALRYPDAAGTFALTADKLSAFAATTSAELAGVVSDETGSGLLVYNATPTLRTSATIDTATATDDKFALSVTTGGAGQFTLTLSPLDVTADRLLRLPDADGTLALTGVYLPLAGGTMTGSAVWTPGAALTSPLDVSDANIVNALTAGANDILATNWGVTGADGNITTAGDVAVNGDNIGADGTLVVTGATGLTMTATAGNATINAVTDFDVLVSTATTNSGISVAADADTDDLTFETTGTAGDLICNSADALDLNAAGAVTIDSSASTIGIGVDNVAQNISIGTSGARPVIAVGSAAAVSATVDVTTNISLDVVGTAGAGGSANLSVVADNEADDLTIETTGTLGDLLFNTADDFALSVAAGAIIQIGDDAVAKTTYIGGCTASGTDSVNIATDGTALDALDFGNANAGTTFALTGGDDWSIAATGTITTDDDVNVNGGHIDSSAAAGLLINASAGPISIGDDDVDQNVSIGTAGQRVVTVGSTHATATTTIQTSDGALGLETTTGTINVGDTATAKAIDIGGVTNSGTDTVSIATEGTAADGVSIGSVHANSTLTLEAGSTATGIQIGNGATAHGVQIAGNATGDNDVLLGGANAGSTVTIEAGTAATGVQIANGATAHGVQIASNATGDNDVVIGGANAGSTVTIEAGTAATAVQIANGATAHGVQIATGAAVQTVVLGSTNTTSTTTINAGSGGLNLVGYTIETPVAAADGGGHTAACVANWCKITTAALADAAGTCNHYHVTNANVAATTGAVAVIDTYAGTGLPFIQKVTPGAGTTQIDYCNMHAATALNAVMVFTLKVSD